MLSYSEIIKGACTWQGVLDTSIMTDDLINASHQLADAAKAGNWSAVMKVLDRQCNWLVINQWRPGGTAWFTALHQAAWHRAPTEVVEQLLGRGALRSLRDSKGRTAFDVAADHHRKSALQELLRPPRSPLTQTQLRALDARLAELIDGRIQGRLYDKDLRTVLRYPPVEILHELPGQRVWFPHARQVRIPHRAAARSPRSQELVRPGGRLRPSPLSHPRVGNMKRMVTQRPLRIYRPHDTPTLASRSQRCGELHNEQAATLGSGNQRGQVVVRAPPRHRHPFELLGAVIEGATDHAIVLT
jgi:hypothetical protein